jgi:hypothetical protein
VVVVVCVCVLLLLTVLPVGVMPLHAAENAPKLMKKFAKTSNITKDQEKCKTSIAHW